MTPAKGALRQGVLWDLLGRVHHRDIREVTVDQFVLRYHVARGQAQRVEALALDLFRQIAPKRDERVDKAAQLLGWGAKLHEIGISIAQGGYHKHSAYMLANAEMPGFSRQEQGWLSNLVLAQRGRLPKMRTAFADDSLLACAALCLRLAVIFHRSRRTTRLPPVILAARTKGGYRLRVPRDWLTRHLLVAVALETERSEWAALDVDFALALED
jgi:exopolyphosphatase/guanosine-5'-triphosphate,3'-diphosphate pyrophosphatase